jgi:hypothetical protein
MLIILYSCSAQYLTAGIQWSTVIIPSAMFISAIFFGKGRSDNSLNSQESSDNNETICTSHELLIDGENNSASVNISSCISNVLSWYKANTDDGEMPPLEFTPEYLEQEEKELKKLKSSVMKEIQQKRKEKLKAIQEVERLQAIKEVNTWAEIIQQNKPKRTTQRPIPAVRYS